MTTTDYPQTALSGLLATTAQRHPDKTAIKFKERAISFKEFDAASNQLARALATRGVEKGVRVGLFMPNCPEFEVAFYAALKLGAVPVPINPSYRERELTYQGNEAGISVLVTHPVVLPVVDAVRHHLNTLNHVLVVGAGPQGLDPAMVSQPSTPVEAGIRPEDLAALPFSSGTTGLPKGVMLTHSNLVTNHIQFGTAAGICREDRLLVYLPLYHIYGVLLMGVTMWSGATQVLMERFDLAEVVRLVEEESITWLFVVPPVLLALANAPGLRADSFKSLKFAMNAAAPLAVDVARRVEDRLGVTIVQAYGLTESSPDTHMSPLEPGRIKLESCGVPVADTEQRVVDSETGKRTLGPGEIGEIVVRGPQVMRGYWNAPEQTANAIRDGWLYTGDIGRIDEEGYVFLVDRKKEMIKFKAFSIAPAELEALLLEHPEVDDCGVTGVPDPEAGEVPKAFVVLREGAQTTERDLADYVAQRVAGYKQVRHWQFLEAIPRTPTGKILRRVLKEMDAPARETD